MSEVVADGVQLNPKKALMQETQNLSNDIAAPEPEGADALEAQSSQVRAANNAPAGRAGGVPHGQVWTSEEYRRARRHQEKKKR